MFDVVQESMSSRMSSIGVSTDTVRTGTVMETVALTEIVPVLSTESEAVALVTACRPLF